jgi:hypothetical protein
MTSNPFAFATYDIRKARLLQPDVSKFAKDFLVAGLHNTLVEYGCGPYEVDAHIDWYWRESKCWKAAAYPEFVALARKKLSDRVGYTRRRREAETTVAKLYDKAMYMPVEFDDVIAAINFLAPSQPMPNKFIENEGYSIVDVTLRESSPRVMRVERDFLPTLERLFPWRRDEDRIVKAIPTAPRDLDLNVLAFWKLYPDSTPREIEHARLFRNGDRLDWTRGNLRSKWRDNAQRQKDSVPAEYMEPRTADGSVRHFNRGHVSWPTSESVRGD